MRIYVDYQGQEIRLSDEVLAKILRKHPEMIDHLDAIADALANPIAVLPDLERPNTVRYYGNVERLGKRIRVPVKFLPGEAWIATAFLTDRMK